MIRLIGEKTENYISTNKEVYSNLEKYGYNAIQKPYDIDNIRFAEFFMSATEANKTDVNSDDMINGLFAELNNQFKDDALYVKSVDEASSKYVNDDGLIEIHITSDTTSKDLTNILNIVKTFLAQEYLDNITLTYSEANYILDASNVNTAVDQMLTAIGAKGALSSLNDKEFDIVYNFNEQAKNKGKGTYKVKFVADIVNVPTNDIIENVAQSILPEEYTDEVNIDQDGNVSIYLDEEIEINNEALLAALNDVFEKNEVISAINVNNIKIERGKVSEVLDQLKALEHSVGDSLTISFEFDGLAQVASDNSAEITINFKNSVNTDELFEAYKNKTNAERDKVLGVDYANETGTLTLTIKDGPELKIPSNTGIVTEITNALSGNYDKITVTYGEEESSIEFTQDDLSESKVYLKVAQLVADLLGIDKPTQVNNIQEKLKAADFGDLAGKSFTIVFGTDSKKVDEKGSHEEYTVVFKTELEIDKYVNQIVDKVTQKAGTFGFDATLDSKTKELFFNIKSTDKHLSDIKDSDIFDVMWALANNKRVESVTLNIDDDSILLDKNSIKLTDTSKMFERVLGALNIQKEKLSKTLLSSIDAEISLDVKLITNDYVSLASSNLDSTTDVTYTLRIGKFYDANKAITEFIAEFNSKYTYNQYKLVLGENNNIQLVITPQYTNTNQLGNIDNLSENIKSVLDSKIKLANLVQSVTLTSIDGKSYPNPDEASIRKVLYDIAGLEKRVPANLSPANLNKKGFDLEITLNEDVEFKDEIENAGKYHVDIIVSEINVNSLIKNNVSSLGGNYFTATYDENTKTVTLALKNVNTKIKDVHDTNLFVLLNRYTGLLSAKVDETPIDSKETLETILIGLTGKDENATLEDLNGKSSVITFIAGEENFDVTVKFDTSSAIVKDFNSASSESLDTLFDKGVEKVYLSGSLSSDLHLDKDDSNFEIVGAGNTITGKITVSNKNVNLKLTNVNITGEIEVTGDNAIITGSAEYDEDGKVTNWNTIVTGGIKANNSSVKNLTIDKIKIDGTQAGLTETGSKKAVVDATNAEHVTLTDSNISYIGAGEKIYSLLHINGESAKITGNTFDVSKVKNPIEFKWAGTGIKNATISNNTFTGDNYDSADSHNIINVYKLAADAVVDIKYNTFKYANSMLRISNPDNNDVTFNVVGNHVEAYNEEDTERRGLIVIRPNQNIDLSHITINHADNTFGPNSESYTYDETKTEDKKGNSFDTRLIYVYNKNEEQPINHVQVKNYVEPTE